MDLPPQTEGSSRPLRQAARLMLLVALLALPSLPSRELLPTDEPRFALVARQMVEDPAPLIPHLGYDAATRGGEVYSDKPPVFFWLISLFSFLTGGVNEISTRLPSFFGAIAAVLLTWRLGRLLLDDSTGYTAALVLATSSQFFQRAAWCSIDMLLTGLCLGTTYCWLAAARASSRPASVRLSALGGGIAAAATLSKGPVGLIFPLTFLAADRLAARFESFGALWRALRRGPSGGGYSSPDSALRQGAGNPPPGGALDPPPASGSLRAAGTAPPGADERHRSRETPGATGRDQPDSSRSAAPAWLAGALGYAVPVALWIAAILALGGRAYATDILFRQNVTRYVAAWNNLAPWYYYFYRIPLGLFPWTLMLPAGLIAMRGARAERARPLRGLLFGCLALFLFFSASTGKRGVYVLPLYFALAILIAAAWRRSGEGVFRRIASIHVFVLLLLGLLAPVALPLAAKSRAPGLVLPGLILGLVLAAATIATAALFRRGERDAALSVTAWGVALLLCVGSFVLVPEVNRRAGVGAFGAELASVARPDDFLVVDQEGYEQILFYSHLKGTRRDFDLTRVSSADGRVSVGPKIRKKKGAGTVSGGDSPGRSSAGGDFNGSDAPGSDAPERGDNEPDAPALILDAPGDAAAGRSLTEAQDQRRVTTFPAEARVLFVVKEERAGRIRESLGPGCRTLLAGKLYGKPYLVIASRG